MRRTIHLRFTAEVETDAEAWEICDRLEQAAMRQDFTGVSTWFEGMGSREGILVPEGQEAKVSDAMSVERGRFETLTGVGDGTGAPLVPAVFGQED